METAATAIHVLVFVLTAGAGLFALWLVLDLFRILTRRRGVAAFFMLRAAYQRSPFS